MSPSTERHRVLRIGILTLLLGLGMGLLAGSLYAQHRAEGVLALQRGVILSHADTVWELERQSAWRSEAYVKCSSELATATAGRVTSVAIFSSPDDADRIRELGGALGALTR